MGVVVSGGVQVSGFASNGLFLKFIRIGWQVEAEIPQILEQWPRVRTVCDWGETGSLFVCLGEDTSNPMISYAVMSPQMQSK